MGYLRARRSIKLGPGVKLNLNKRSMGVTVGGRGAHYTVNTRGQRTTTVGIPGTGVSYSSRASTLRPAKARTSSPRATRRSPPAAPARRTPPAHPGVFARHYERAFYLGTTKLTAGDDKAALAAFRDADTSDDKHRAVSPALFAGVLAFQLGDHEGAVPYLERVTNSAQPLPDKLMSKYAPSLHLSVEVNRISLPVPMGSVAAAMETQGLPDAALEAYRDALRSKKRDGQLLKEARYKRAKLYIQISKRAMAKRDLGRLYGEDPEFEDVRALLASLG